MATDSVPLCVAAERQADPRAVSDGVGGTIVTWEDSRNGSYDIYAQRLSASGVPQWTANGVALCMAANDQRTPLIVSDGAGGAIVAWQDIRTGKAWDNYAQRVTAGGALLWGPDGRALSIMGWPTQLVADGEGGAIVTCMGVPPTGLPPGAPVEFDIYAQRVNANGLPQWANGVAVCTAPNIQYAPMVTSDGAGGAIVTWEDYRSGTNMAIYAQRVSAAGAPQWTADGVPVCTWARIPTIISDGEGGAFVTWYGSRSGRLGVYAQRLNADGAARWTADGVPVCAVANVPSLRYFRPKDVILDDSGGFIITWPDFRDGIHENIYAQRVNAAGVAQWTIDGEPVCTAAGGRDSPTIVSDGAGGAIVIWNDFRDTTNVVYTQRLDPSGVRQWKAEGVSISAASEGPSAEPISDGANGAVTTWVDNWKSGTGYDIRAQRMNGMGALQWTEGAPGPITTLSFAASWPNPTSAGATLRFSLPREGHVTLTLFDQQGRRVRELVGGVFAAGPHQVQWDGRDEAGHTVASGIYFARLDQAGESVTARLVAIH